MPTASGRSLDRHRCRRRHRRSHAARHHRSCSAGVAGPDRPIAEITAGRDRRSWQRCSSGSYLGSLMAGALLVFGVSASQQSFAERAQAGGWWIVALVGIAARRQSGSSATHWSLAFVRAVEHGARRRVALDRLLRATMRSVTLRTVPLGIFLARRWFRALASGAFPRWLTWAVVALARSRFSSVGVASIAGGELEGRPFGIPLALGYLGTARLDRRRERRPLARTCGARVKLAASTA